jgi:hypothetical protein
VRQQRQPCAAVRRTAVGEAGETSCGGAANGSGGGWGGAATLVPPSLPSGGAGGAAVAAAGGTTGMSGLHPRSTRFDCVAAVA